MAPKMKRVKEVGTSGKKDGANNGEAAKKQKTAQERKEKLAALNFLTDRYLVKRDPGDISIDDIARAKNQTVEWNGVRTVPSLDVLRRMKNGNQVLLYQTGKQAGVVGIAEVVKQPYEDASQFDQSSRHWDKKAGEKDRAVWLSVDLKLKDRAEVSLTDLKEHKEGKLADFPLFEHPRLMVMPLTKQQWDNVLSLVPGYMEDDGEEEAEEEHENGDQGHDAEDEESVGEEEG